MLKEFKELPSLTVKGPISEVIKKKNEWNGRIWTRPNARALPFDPGMTYWSRIINS